MESDSILSGNISEQRWVDQISKNFDDEVGNISDIPVCVFSVPKSTSHFKPEAYVPLAIALGPYHHFETHLYQMERYKVAAVKDLLNEDQLLAFETLVINRLKEKELMIRACYHKYINLDGDTLAWIIAIDGLFLLDVFRHYGDVAPLMPKKLINDGVLYRDIMVLENQIPLRLLSEIRKILRLSSTDDNNNGEQELFSMLREFCEVHSPLKLGKESNHGVGTSYLHLLDLMYHLIVNNQSTTDPLQVVVMQRKDNDDAMKWKEKDDINLTEIEEVVEMGLRLGVGKKADRPIQVIKNIPWEKISNLVGLKISQQSSEEDDNKPEVAEIEIPSVSSLTKYGQISFCHTTGGIRDIKFEESEATLYLPVITLDIYSEVVLRNLIAYEMATYNSTPELAQYVDLMSGIIDTEADAKLLRDKGIIRGNLNNKEIADLFNGINKCNGHKSGNKTVKLVNEYYNNRPRIKALRFIKKDLICSKRVATVVLTIILFLLMSLYSFCEVYGCPKLFDKK
ncbi:putative UPF0481 protein At3g02645 [Lactuca sativa]|uniref:putative UPF0481 protein At3g02645 n=1 Tax=Lactuca sativa TaxID=4236 RepID=UPI000CBA65B5|nr:putative UPF0481 protein At3g02645 [Lactuca sativa]